MSIFGNNKPVTPQVLSPDFEAMTMPVEEADMRAAAAIRPGAMLAPQIAEYFILQKNGVPYLQLSQPNGKPFIDLHTDEGLKRFYVFALPVEPGSAEYHDDPSYMVAMQCRVEQVQPNVWSIMPEKLFRGPEAYFVMSISFACCSSPGGRGRTMLYSDTSEREGPFLNRAFAGATMRSDIKKVWDNLSATVLEGVGIAALHHLAKDLTGGGCQGHGHLINPAKSAHWKGASLRL